MKLAFHTDFERGNTQQKEWKHILDADVGTIEHEFLISILANDFSKIKIHPETNETGIVKYIADDEQALIFNYIQSNDTYILFPNTAPSL